MGVVRKGEQAVYVIEMATRLETFTRRFTRIPQAEEIALF